MLHNTTTDSTGLRGVPFIALLIASLVTCTTVAQAKANSDISSSDSGFSSFVPIPHSTVTESSGSGIVKAKLSCATERYAHGVLGDAIEAGCVIVENEAGDVFTYDLPEHQVFEDLIPRIADVNGDALNDVVLVLSEQGAGAALAIYTLKKTGSGQKLEELAATPAIGTGNRWLAPIGIADFTGNGAMDIAYVQTPHIGGILRVWTMVDGTLQEIAQAYGYSNHSIGDTRVSTAKIHDFNDDGVVDIALPDQGRRNTVWITLDAEFKVLDSKKYEMSDFD